MSDEIHLPPEVLKDFEDMIGRVTADTYVVTKMDRVKSRFPKALGEIKEGTVLYMLVEALVTEMVESEREFVKEFEKFIKPLPQKLVDSISKHLKEKSVEEKAEFVKALEALR
jgi:hypothetical protein